MNYMILGKRTGTPYLFQKKYFGGFVIGLNGLCSLWINKCGFSLSFPKPFSILRWIELEVEYPPQFSILIRKDSWVIFQLPSLKWM